MLWYIHTLYVLSIAGLFTVHVCCAFMCGGECAHAHGGVHQRTTLGVISQMSYTLFLETGSLIGLELTDLSRLGG